MAKPKSKSEKDNQDSTKKYQGVYWDESIPHIKGYLLFEVKDRGLKKGESLDVQFDESEFSLFVRCRKGVSFYFLRVTDFQFQDNALVETIKRNRKPLIERGLIDNVKGFD